MSIGLFLLSAIIFLPNAWRSTRASFALLQGLAALRADQPQAARVWYDHAVAVMPENVVARRLLARAALAEGNPSAAAAHLEAALQARPKDRLVQRELAQAYDAAGEYDKADKLWTDLGVTVEQLVKLGETYLADQHYSYAYSAYRRATQLDEYERFDLLFRLAILAVLTGDVEAPTWLSLLHQHDRNFRVYELDDEIQLMGTEFRRMMPAMFSGRLLRRSEDGLRGGFNHIIGEALIVLSVQQGGVYRLQANVLGGPLPIEMAVDVDRRQVLDMRLEPDDNPWPTVEGETSVILTPGLHTVSVWFLPYPKGDDQDYRFAGLRWVNLTRQD